MGWGASNNILTSFVRAPGYTPRRDGAIIRAMPDPSTAATLLFLREEDLRQGVELLYFATRDFSAECDALLDERGLGRPHHLALHFIARQPQITVSELAELTALSKQSLGRVLDLLLAQGLITQR